MFVFGEAAGKNSFGTSYTNLIGNNTGYGATSAQYSNFIGNQAGYGATTANNSNFIGNYAGRVAANVNSSNFIGNYAGNDAYNASASNFIGLNAGKSATTAGNSNFMGQSAGQSATTVQWSNFIGFGAGQSANNAQWSNFMGQDAGQYANNVNYSNFIGFAAGQNADNAPNSNLFGYNVGKSFNSNFIGSNNIIIGTNISLPNGATNGINIGGILFGLNAYGSTAGNPLISAQNNGRIGINVVSPTTNLHVVGTQPGAIRLEDTTQAAGYVLTSDANGVGRWAPPANGPTGPTGATGLSGSTGQTGPTGLPGLFAQTANSATVGSTTTALSIVGTGVGSLSVPPNGFSIGDSFLCKLVGHLSSVNNDTLRILLRSNGAILADTGAITMPGITNKHWVLDINFTIRSIGATGVASISSGGLFTYTKNASNAFEGAGFSIVNSTDFDTTIANNLVITAQWSSNNATNQIYTESFYLTKMY
jgi:hypothetical protein